LRRREQGSVKENLTRQDRQGYVDDMDNHSAVPSSALRAMSTRELAQHLKASHDEFTSRNDHDSELINTVIVQLGEALGRCGQLYAGVPDLGPTLGPPRHLVMHGISEQHPSAEWLELFDRTWTSYRSWFFGGSGPGSTAGEAERALRHHMPELVAIWKRLRDLGGGGADVGHFLTMWNPPPFAPGCSQLVVAEPERTLVRNYDYAPELFEGVSMSSRWSDRSVVGTSDCLWGLVDGMNDRGLVASLTLGGVVGTGEGFAIPLVLRYLLEVCDTVADARSVLQRVPVAGHYNLTFSDAEGASMTAFVGPGREPEFSRAAHATNHRGLVPDDPQLARRLRSVERQDTLIALERRGATASSVVNSFRSPGLRSLDFDAGFGTLYTAEYRPDRGSVTYHWPSHDWVRSFRSRSEQIRVRLQ
jgi:predicted choloylglycine hydrolase